jgi:hypothetical protein
MGKDSRTLWASARYSEMRSGSAAWRCEEAAREKRVRKRESGRMGEE